MRSPTVLPPSTLLIGQMLPVFMQLAVRFSTVLLTPTLLLGQMLPVFIRLAVGSSTAAPYTTARRMLLFLEP